MTTKTTSDKLTVADESWGYRFGVDGLMSIDDAANFCGCSTRTIERLAERGKIRKGKLVRGKRSFCKRSIVNHVGSSEV